MTSLQPRAPYTDEELKKLYPDNLQLQLVQVLLRHGERTPVSPRFQNAGLAAFWPYCSVARELVSATREGKDKKWNAMQWRRRLETFGNDDGPIIAKGPRGEVDKICNLGELTDKGRETTEALGARLRKLYVDQLKFMPASLQDADMIYLRATPIPRALESLQEAFWGMYPSQHRSESFPPVTIITRDAANETLFPNDGNCRRLAQLSRAFAQRTADRWNATDDMEYLNKKFGKWMPEYSKRVAIDSHPRLSGIMDTINSTLAHGPETRLPKEFYDQKGRDIIDKIGCEEWFSGYSESEEYRSLGIGGLMGDLVERMVGNVEKNNNDGHQEIGGQNGSLGDGRGGEHAIKLGLSGCHDTTLAAILTSLGAFEGEKWPPYTSHVALELFKGAQTRSEYSQLESPGNLTTQKGWFANIFGAKSPAKAEIGRSKIGDLTAAQKSKLDGYYVRIRFNDRVMSVPGCKPAGKHLEGDESFCTLAAFKTIVDRFTPENWKLACNTMDASPFPPKPEPAGY